MAVSKGPLVDTRFVHVSTLSPWLRFHDPDLGCHTDHPSTDADAYFGLDDLREWCIRQRTAIPIYLNRPTYEIVASSFPYLVDSTQASGGGDV
jgi:hypothetical protein